MKYGKFISYEEVRGFWMMKNELRI